MSSTPADFEYLDEVLRSDLPVSSKLFLAELIANSGFRALYGLYNSTWEGHAEYLNSITILEKAGYLAVARDNDRVRYVAHRDCIEFLSGGAAACSRTDT